jgi:beta-xylosidase
MRAFRLVLLIVAIVTANVGISCSISPLATALPFLPESAASRLAALTPDVLQRPVLDQNFPDPAVIEAGGIYYAYATNFQATHIQAARSADLIEWTVLPDAMPDLAPWVEPRPNQIWAPEVVQLDATYRMYYTARSRALDKQCIGVAVSDQPEGPFRDTAAHPLICPPGFKLAIDPHPYIDGRGLYLYFSGTCCGGGNAIYVQQLSPDGLATLGEPSLLLEADVPWEGAVIEAPTMLKHRGKHYLFYSGNNYRDHTYAVGYARCDSPLGPCAKAAENPVLATGTTAAPATGPGHQSIIKVGTGYWMLHHGWHGAIGYRNGGSRAMWLQPLTWRGSKPILSRPGLIEARSLPVRAGVYAHPIRSS